MKWLYNNREFNEELAERYFGFVYLITHKDTGKFYIGKKQFHSSRKMTPKELRECDDRRRKRTRKQSNWRTYNSSSIELESDIKAYGEDAFYFEILYLAPDAINLTYYELKYQFHYDVLIRESYNKTIHGTFYKGRIK